MGQVNIDTIKTAIKSILDAANTTTGSPIDLSSGLNTRVQRILKINPTKVPIQPSLFPFVTIYALGKSVEQITMGHRGDQTSARKKGVLTLDIFCACYEPFYTDFNEDQGIENVQKLTENVEEILRANANLSSSVAWHETVNVRWDTIPWEEEAHLKAGLITVEATIHY